VVPKHSHDNEQLTYILEGTLRFWLGEDGSEMVDVHAGEVLHIPSNLPHKAEALEPLLQRVLSYVEGYAEENGAEIAAARHEFLNYGDVGAAGNAFGATGD